MTRTRHLTAALALAAVALAGCSSDKDPQPSPAAAPSTLPATTSTATPPSPSASTSITTADDLLALGKAFTFHDGTMTTTVLRYKQPIGDDPGPDLAKGETLGGIEVNTCNLPKSTEAQQVSVAPWSLEWSDGTTTDSPWSGTVSAEYPYELKTIKPGRCVKGWIVFSVPEKRKPALAVYEGQSNQGQPAEWKLS